MGKDNVLHFRGSIHPAVVVVVVMRRVRGYLLRRVASANARVLKGSLLSVSGSTSILPKIFSRVLMVAGHLSQWETVSSSSSHSGHVALVLSSNLFL